MPRRKPPVIDFSQQDSTLQVFPHPPLLASCQIKWNNIHLEHHQWHSHDLPEHSHAQHTIVLLHTNHPIAIERMVDGQFQTERVNSSDTWVLGANVPHGSWSGEVAEFTILALEPTLVAQTAYELFDPDRIEVTPTLPKFDPLLYHVGLALKAELETAPGGDRLYIESAATMLSAHLLRHYVIAKTNRDCAVGFSRYRLQQVLEYIQDQLERDLGIAELAAFAQMSSSYFIRSFKQATGLTPRQYIIRCRVERAQRLLNQGKLSISDIARAVGFFDQSHLTKNFKRLLGLTPKEALRHK